MSVIRAYIKGIETTHRVWLIMVMLAPISGSPP